MMHGDPTWSIPEVRKIIGNVNCGLLQTGTDEECRADVMRALRKGGMIYETGQNFRL